MNNGWHFNRSQYRWEYWYNGEITAWATVEAWHEYWNHYGWGRYNA